MTRGALEPGRKPLRERTRLPEDAPSYPAGHRIRLESLIILHEGEFSAGGIAKMLGEDVKVVTNHLRDLYDAGCIEFVGYKGRATSGKPSTAQSLDHSRVARSTAQCRKGTTRGPWGTLSMDLFPRGPHVLPEQKNGGR